MQSLLYGPAGRIDPLLLTLLLLWSLFWKGLALWRAAGKGQKYWFVAMLVLSTLGILEIIYLKFFQNPKTASGKSSPKKR